MSKYFVLQHLPNGDGYAAVMLSTTIAMFDTVLAAEEAAGANCLVYDADNFEKPVPLVAPGTPVLVDGQWVVSK